MEPRHLRRLPAGLWADYAYCTGTSEETLTRTSLAPSPTTTQGASPAPGPTQANSVIDSCNKYDAAKDGDYCSLFAQRNGFGMADLVMWNRVLGAK